VDWDKIRIFCDVADAGSFTRAGDHLGLSQSAVSRQISALEQDLKVPLFHRHARGLILTEQGDLLYQAAREIRTKLDVTRSRFQEASEVPSGELRVNATVGFGATWLARRIGEFLDLYPDMRVQLILTNEELDVAMREADLAIRLRRPDQPSLIQRRLFTVHYHAYAAPLYLERFGEPETLADLERHRIIALGGHQPGFILAAHQLAREHDVRLDGHLVVNDTHALRQAVRAGAGIGMVPDYAAEIGTGLVRVLRDIEMPALDAYLVYPEEMRAAAKLQVFRDFLVAKAQRWSY
jgi:DNA-binding transcriptional LysR family regulator